MKVLQLKLVETHQRYCDTDPYSKLLISKENENENIIMTMDLEINSLHIRL